MGGSGADPASQVKKEKLKVTQGILDIVSEDPEIEHIPDDMDKAAVEKH